jgi:aspartyl-tRNA(Asn)/glutamyl-tRNA(Gln) amidotransferase subunit C
MAFSLEEIRKLSHLARLSLDDDETSRMQHDLDSIVGYVESLQAVNVDNVEPMTHAIPADLPRRQDIVQASIGRQGLLGSAGYEEGLVRVPKIIE